jgi:hypothetical protein
MTYECMHACMFEGRWGNEPLFPPSSSRTLPNLDWTFLPTILPTFSLPVKETGWGQVSVFLCPTVLSKITFEIVTHPCLLPRSAQ